MMMLKDFARWTGSLRWSTPSTSCSTSTTKPEGAENEAVEGFADRLILNKCIGPRKLS